MANDGYKRPLPANQSHKLGASECVGCGAKFNGDLDWETHVCDDSRLESVDKMRRNWADTGAEQGHTTLERLSDGFRMLKDHDVEPSDA